MPPVRRLIVGITKRVAAPLEGDEGGKEPGYRDDYVPPRINGCSSVLAAAVL